MFRPWELQGPLDAQRLCLPLGSSPRYPLTTPRCLLLQPLSHGVLGIFSPSQVVLQMGYFFPSLMVKFSPFLQGPLMTHPNDSCLLEQILNMQAITSEDLPALWQQGALTFPGVSEAPICPTIQLTPVMVSLSLGFTWGR